MFRVILMGFIVAWMPIAAAMSIAPEPLPPVRWEDSADRRFEPRVEQVLIDVSRHGKKPSQDDVAGYWQDWGPEAADRLVAILEDPHWDEFDPYATSMLYQCPLEAGLPVLTERVQAQIDAIPDEARHILDGVQAPDLSDFANYQKAAAVPFFVELAEDAPIGILNLALLGLASTNSEEGRAAMKPIIERLANSDAPEDWPLAVRFLPGIEAEDGWDRAIALAEKFDPAQAAQLRESRERMAAFEKERARQMAGQTRAQEPMSVVLEREGAGR